MQHFGGLALIDKFVNKIIDKLQNQEQQEYKTSSNNFLKNLKRLWNNRRK